MVMRTFSLPDLGEGLRQAEIVSWHVAEGDHVVADQPLVSVETEKAVVEVPAPRSGTIETLHGAVGDIIKIGAPLVDFAEASRDEGAIVGELGSAKRPRAAAKRPAPARPARSAALRARVIPSARRRAGELGVDLAKVRGSGPEGVITLGDIEAAAEPRPRESYAPLRGPRRAMAEAMAGAGREVVPATVTDVADVGAWIGDGDVTVRLVRAIAKAASAEPSLNAWFDGNSLARRLHGQLDLGIATDTVDGLFVPVLRDAGRASPEAIRAGIDRLRAAVTDRTISREDLTGATFTLSNFGMIGGRHASLVVMPPQVAIVGAGRIFAPDGRGKAWLLPLSVSFDHRAVTGGEAARFLARALEDLELCE